MKQKILIVLIALLVSIATLNTLSKQNANDVCLNQIGVGVAVAGRHLDESGTTEWIGRGVAALGGSCAATGILGLAGVVVVSNPVGWVIGGIVVGL